VWKCGSSRAPSAPAEAATEGAPFAASRPIGARGSAAPPPFYRVRSWHALRLPPLSFFPRFSPRGRMAQNNYFGFTHGGTQYGYEIVCIIIITK